MIIGLIGGVCAGKSSVAKLMQQRGVFVWDADRSVREIQSRPDIIRRIAESFGDDCVADDGSLDRTILAKKVFSDPKQLKILTEEIIWPETAKAAREAIRNANAQNARILLLDAPTLLESGLDSLCDRIIFVDAPPEVREKRAVQNRGWSPGEIARREAHMMPQQEKKARAHFIITNNGKWDDLEMQIDHLLSEVTGN